MRMGFAGIIAVAFLALEIVGMALMAGKIGVLATFAWLLADLLAGGWLMRGAWAGALPDLAQAAQRGRDPLAELWKSGRRFLAGLLLIFPGFITDVLALVLLLGAGLPRGPAAGAPPPRWRQQAPGAGRRDDGAIEGEFRREDG